MMVNDFKAISQGANSNFLNCILWKDISKKKPKIIKAISTIHSDKLINFEDKRKKSQNIPEAIAEYKKYMKGIDIMDAAVECYKFPHKSLRWWRPVFNHILEIIINNSLIWYKQYLHLDITPQKFRESIVDGLLEGWNPKLTSKRPHLLIANPKLNVAFPAINLYIVLAIFQALSMIVYFVALQKREKEHHIFAHIHNAGFFFALNAPVHII